MHFIWDQRKATENRRRHGISFEDAQTAFDDVWSITGADPDHSVGESRWITIAHTEEEDIIRIISARVATQSERKLYEEG